MEFCIQHKRNLRTNFRILFKFRIEQKVAIYQPQTVNIGLESVDDVTYVKELICSRRTNFRCDKIISLRIA